MSDYFYLIYTAFYLGLLIWGIILYQRSRRWGTLLIVLVTAGVLYDNLILSVGSRLGEGDLLFWLSVPRFALHQLLLPWLIYAVYEQLRAAGVTWAQRTWARRAALALSALVMLVGIVTRLWTMQLQIAEMDGVLRYINVGASGPPWVSILSIGMVGVLGIFYGFKKVWPWTTLAALVVFAGEGIGDEAMRRLLGSGLEIVLVVVLLLAESRLPMRKRKSRHHGED